MPASLLGWSWPIIGVVEHSREVLTRPASPPDTVLRYGPRADQIADLRLPPRTRGAPLVVLLHGGFWRNTWDRTHTRPMADGLVDAGVAVITPEYARTGNGGGWPVTFDDVALAVAAAPSLVAAAAAGSVDPTRTVLVGHSAGGQLALWCASQGLPAEYAGVVALAPVADLTEAFRLDLDGGAVVELMGGGPRELPDRYDLVDPCRLAAPAVPVVILHGTDDVAVPTGLSERCAARSRARLQLLPDVDHFGLIDPRSTAWPAVLAAVMSVNRTDGTG
jgi:acetyl esterase/lipase